MQAVLAPAPVDLRVLQANERTLLAWVRTGLAFMAFGFAVARIGIWLRGTGGANASRSVWIGAAFVVLGMASSAVSALRYVRVRRAILEGRVMPPGNVAPLFVALGLALLGGIVVAYLVMLSSP